MVNLVPFIWLVCVSQSVMASGGCWGSSSSVISGAFPRVEILQRNAFPLLLLPSLSLSVLLSLPSFTSYLSPSLVLSSSPLSPSSDFPFLPTSYSTLFICFHLFPLHSSLFFLLSSLLATSPLLSIPLPATLSLTDRKTNVRSERLFNLKLCCLALNINSACLSEWVRVCVKMSLLYVERGEFVVR